jgi:hypothetical protein
MLQVMEQRINEFINKLKIKIGMTASDILCGMGYKYDSDENLMLREMRATLNYFNELRVKTEKTFYILFQK